MTSRSNHRTHLKPGGWLAVGVLAVLIVGALIVLIRPLTDPIRDLPTAGNTARHATITPYVSPTLTPVASATPLPAGWTQQPGLNGQSVLVPPDAIKQQIEAAFETALACRFVEDAPDAELLKQPDKVTLCDQAQAVSTLSFAADRADNTREIVTLGVLNPVQCQSVTHCTLAQAKLAIKGVILYGEVCGQIKQASPCIVREGLSGLQPYQLHILTLQQEAGIWHVARWDIEPLPGPPPSP